MTVAELRSEANRRGIELPKRAKKAQIEALLTEADLTVVGAVESDLLALGPKLARSGLAATALSLARSLDAPKVSATAKSNCARSLLDVLDRLRELAPPTEETDSLDELRARRAARLAGGAAA